MKTVIICGGKGERLREETEFKPKPMVEIGGVPILQHIMKIYSAHGFKDFILCLGYKGKMIKDHFLHLAEMSNDFTLRLSEKREIRFHGKETVEDWDVTFADTGLETLSGGRVARIKKYVADDEHFFYTYGDGLSDIDIKALLAYHKKMGRVVTITGIHPPSAFGVLETRGGLVSSFNEKPSLDGVINGGFWVCNRKVFDYITTEETCQFEGDPLKRLAHDGQLAVFEHNGYWDSMDTYKQVSRLNRIWESGNVPWKIWD